LIEEAAIGYSHAGLKSVTVALPLRDVISGLLTAVTVTMPEAESRPARCTIRLA